MPDSVPMEAFATAKVSALLEAAVSAMRAAAEDPDAEAIHKVRVSIRRLQQALRTFGQFFSESGLQRVRSDLKETITAAGNLRNYDIAVELVKKSGADLVELRSLRRISEEEFRATLQRVAKKDLTAEWCSGLGLPS